MDSSFVGGRFWKRSALSAALAAALLTLVLLLVRPTAAMAPSQEPYDLGDAPDSVSNHYGVSNVAYPGPVMGRFPTVWSGTPVTQPAGPIHFTTWVVWLGEGVTNEDEADIGPDTDGVNNILLDASGAPDPAIADRDGADDGWLNPHIPMPHCGTTVLRVRVSRSMSFETGRMFLNVWFDGNRDGDWADRMLCPDQDTVAHEWIVRDFVIDTSVIPGYVDILVPTALVMNVTPDEVAWVRFSLTEHPALRPGAGLPADGRGPHEPNGFELGETEDYLYKPPEPGDPGDLVITKTVELPPGRVLVPGDVMTYVVEVAHQGGTGFVPVEVVDVLPPEVKLVSGPVVTEVAPDVAPLIAGFDPGVGPSGMVKWVGHMSPGGKLRLAMGVRILRCPPTDQTSEHRIVNEAKARLLVPEGQDVSDAISVVVGCEIPPSPELKLIKRIVLEVPEGVTETINASILPGQTATFLLVLEHAGQLTETVHISDDLPLGLRAVGASTSQGAVQITHNGHTVVWDGSIGPHAQVHIRIKVQGDDRLVCGRAVQNQARWFTHYHEGKSNVVDLALRCHDLGDAPDSTNHYAIPMTTYGSAVTATFPTVYQVAPPIHGPLHLLPVPFHLGRRVSFELEADVGPDSDGKHNIEPPANLADQDRADDGLDLIKVAFDHCKVTRFPVVVSIAPQALPLLENNDGIGFINVWLDGNRDGDWADVFDCPGYNGAVPEHIVIDWPVNAAALGPGLHTIYVSTVEPVYMPTMEPAWLRVTLSERPSNKDVSGGAYGDGRGFKDPFRLGETEDYIYQVPEQEGDSDLVVVKRGRLRHDFNVAAAAMPMGWIADWWVRYENKGPQPAHNVTLVDELGPGQQLISLQTIPPVPATGTNPYTLTIGSLPPGGWGMVLLRTRLVDEMPPGVPVTNTVLITGTGDVDPTHNQATAVLTMPLRAPLITFPRPGTTCTGTLTVTGRAGAGLFVDLYVDGALTATVGADAFGHWSHVLHLADGTYTLHAIAKTSGGVMSPPSHPVMVIVDTSLTWNPLSLLFVDEDGHTIYPRDMAGRMDENGWGVFLRRDTTFTATVDLCCSDPNAQVTLELPNLGLLTMLDPDGDRTFEVSFTTPPTGPIAGIARLCTICNLIQRCSDGQVLIDPEGTVYDVTQGTALDTAEVACYVSQGNAEVQVSSLWNAGDFGQVNPQTTAADGYFSFFTPPGTYGVGVTKTGYQAYRSWDLVVTDAPVHFDVPLTPDLAVTPDVTVTVGADGFDPPVLQVAPGTVVAWLNVDTEAHTTTSLTPTVAYTGPTRLAPVATDGWDSGLLAMGERYHRELTTLGTYTYADHENPISVGTVIVEWQTLYLPLVMRNSGG
jgi:plastocyanin